MHTNVGDLPIAEAVGGEECEAAKKKISQRRRAFLKRKCGTRGQADWWPSDKMLKPFLTSGALSFFPGRGT